MNCDPQYGQDELAKIIANLTARRFAGKTVRKKAFNNRLGAFLYEFRREKIQSLFSRFQISRKFSKAFNQALQNCTVKITSTSEKERLKTKIFYLLMFQS